MGIMALLEKQIKDPFRFQLQAESYRVENPISNWNMEQFVMQRGRDEDEMDSIYDVGTSVGREAEVNSDHINKHGRRVKYLHRELT